MNSFDVNLTLDTLGISQYIKSTEELTLVRSLEYKVTENSTPANPERLPRLAFVYETQALATYQRESRRRGSEEDLDATRSYCKAAFVCWQSLLTLPSEELDIRKGISPEGLRLIQLELGEEPIPVELNLAFRLAVTGLVSNRVAETRLELERFDSLYLMSSSSDWRNWVITNVFGAFMLLVRKAKGWSDISVALTRIDQLRELQKSFEEEYLESTGDDADQTYAALELLGLYNLAQLITLTGEYLRHGGSAPQANGRLDRHREQANKAFESANSSMFAHLADLLWMGCRELVHNAIWTHIAGVGQSVQAFGRQLIEQGRADPIVELWPSQQKALRERLLDTYPRAILVQMPTSAGKTLLAKFVIVQTKALNADATIAYIVPTRALVNQVTRDLRIDFRPLNFSVEQAIPAFEIDPTEERLLKDKIDVLVTTQEKLDLLIRSDHEAVQNLSLVVADEAHNIQDGERGARLELLLGTIKRDRPDARFLLLSPFMPNANELIQWLGEDRSIPPISADWRPARRLVGAIDLSGRGQNKQLVFETLPAVDNSDISTNRIIPIASGSSIIRGLSTFTRASVKAFLSRGTTLVLCKGKGTAITRAREIATDLEPIDRTDRLDAVCHYLDAEIGISSTLVECLSKGVAYHHAGLSSEARWLVEALIRDHTIRVVCGTTTLAQGVNFPITTVLVERAKKGKVDLSYQDFWNIAGRAGRTLVDSMGVVAFPTPNKSDRIMWEKFLQGEAKAITSQLAELVVNAEEIAEHFDLGSLRRYPQLSSLLQFLAHAMRVSGTNDIADDVEDLLRASLMYHQAQNENRELVERLLTLCRTYLVGIRNNPKGFLSLADKTGFATPTVREIFRATESDIELTNPANWEPSRLFGSDIEPMRQRIEAIADLPEISLGQGQHGQFNAELVAKIVRDWVQGEDLNTLTLRHQRNESTTASIDSQVSEFSSYLFGMLGRASWGIGALETIALRGQSKALVGHEDAGYVPSMIFFGVPRKEAVWLRMVGVPRIVAVGLSEIWKRNVGSEPRDYGQLRNWVGNLSESDWAASIPKKSELTPKDMQIIWQEIYS